MKNRTVEVSVLRQLSMMGVFDNTVIPMIELVQERTRSNMKNSFLHTMLPILALCLIISNANKGFAKSYNNNNMHPATSFTGKKNMSLRKENKTFTAYI